MWLRNYPYGLGKGITTTISYAHGTHFALCYGVALSQEAGWAHLWLPQLLVLSSLKQVGSHHDLRGVRLRCRSGGLLLESNLQDAEKETRGVAGEPGPTLLANVT